MHGTMCIANMIMLPMSSGANITLPSHKYVQELKSKLPDRSQHTLPAAAHFAQWHLWMAACLTLSMQRATWQILHPACMLSIGMSVGHAICKVYCVSLFYAKQQRWFNKAAQHSKICLRSRGSLAQQDAQSNVHSRAEERQQSGMNRGHL